MTSIALYQLTGELLGLMDKLADGDFDAQTIADTIEGSGLQEAIAQKGAGIEMVARNMEMHVPAIDAEIERLKALRDGRVKKAKALREYLRTNMIAAGITKLESPLFNITLRNNPAAVDVFELGLIPAEYMTKPVAPEPAPDKAAIKAAINAGIEVPGAKLTQTQRLAVA